MFDNLCCVHTCHNVSKLLPPNSCICRRGVRWLSIIWVWFCRWGKLLPKCIIQRWLHLHHTVRRLRCGRDNYANFGRSERRRIFLLWYRHESRWYFIQLNMVGFHWWTKECQLTLSSPIQKSKMFSGTWYIVIEGPDFAYTRTFYLTVDVPTTIIVGWL